MCLGSRSHLLSCIVWRGWSGLWGDGCVECHWRIESAVWILTVFWVCMQSVANVVKRSKSMWFDRLNIWDVCRNGEVAGVSCRGSYRTGSLGENVVWMMAWYCLVCSLNGQYLWICGNASFTIWNTICCNHQKTNCMPQVTNIMLGFEFFDKNYNFVSGINK